MMNKDSTTPGDMMEIWHVERQHWHQIELRKELRAAQVVDFFVSRPGGSGWMLSCKRWVVAALQ